MDEPITKEDLRQFGLLLIHEIRETLVEKPKDGIEVNNPEWLRSKAIRKLMDISAGTLQNLRITGKIRFRKVMGSYYYNRSDIQKLFEEKES